MITQKEIYEKDLIKMPKKINVLYKGMLLSVVRIDQQNYLCGYLKYPPNFDFKCLTDGLDQSESSQESDPLIRFIEYYQLFHDSVTARGNNFIGFDCAHYGDYSPNYPRNGDIYRDSEFVLNKLKHAVDRILLKINQTTYNSHKNHYQKLSENLTQPSRSCIYCSLVITSGAIVFLIFNNYKQDIIN